MKQGQIIKISSNLHSVESEQSVYQLIPRGIFRKDKILPRVGDYVLFDEKTMTIEKILPRKNEFIRPLVSNIDQAFIVTSLVEPSFSTGLLDRFLTLMELHHVKSIICITKEDLTSEKEKEKLFPILTYYKKIGYDVISNQDINTIKTYLSDHTSVFTGQTGAGKSTLLNKLNPTWDLETGAISKALGRGRHTTRNVELYSYWGGKVLDTPGFSALSFTSFSKEQIRASFIDFREYPCPFKDCSHTKEQECAVKKAVTEGKILQTRYQSYLQFIKEVNECK